VNNAAFKVGQMTDYTVITNCGVAHGRCVHNGAILDAGSLANDYRAVIAT
jgi:hypothetical protein